MVQSEPGPSHLAAAVLRRAGPPLALALAVLAAGVVFVRERDRQSDRELARQASLDLVRLQTATIERELDSARSILLHFAGQRTLREFLAGRIPRAELEREYLNYCRIDDSLDQIRLIRPDGVEWVRIERRLGRPVAVDPGALQDKSDRYYFPRTWALERSEVYVSRLDLNVEHGRIEEPWKPVLRLGTPVFDEQGTRRGILVLNHLGRELLEDLARSAARLPGWSALVDGEGHFLDGPDPELSWTSMYGREAAFAARYPAAWERLRHGSEGSFIGGEGMFSYRRIAMASQPGPAIDHDDLELRVVAFVPDELLYAASTRSFRRLAALSGLLGLLLVALAWRLGRAGAVRAIHEERIAASEQRLRALSVRLIDLQEAERRSLSRDLHDELGQLATAITIDLKRARKEGDPERRDALLQRALAGATEVLGSTHRISSRIRSSALDDLGLRAALRWCCEELGERAGAKAELDLDFDEGPVSQRVAVNVFRFVQEALNNVSRHAGASRCLVSVRSRDRALHVTVEDDGVGFDPSEADTGRLGLLGMRERVELLGGRFSLRSTPGGGTRVEAVIPLGGAPAADGGAPA